MMGFNTSLELELDNKFSWFGIGEVINGSRPEYMWTPNYRNYVSIIIKPHEEEAFNKFWSTAMRVIEEDLFILNVQYNVPRYCDEDVNLLQTVYSITEESAYNLLQRFEEIMKETHKTFGEIFVADYADMVKPDVSYI